jgi:hypothetical protein
VAVFVAEQPDVNDASFHFGKIDGIRPAITGGEVFKQENGEEAAQEGIILDKQFHRATFFRQFLLDATDE